MLLLWCGGVILRKSNGGDASGGAIDCGAGRVGVGVGSNGGGGIGGSIPFPWLCLFVGEVT